MSRNLIQEHKYREISKENWSDFKVRICFYLMWFVIAAVLIGIPSLFIKAKYDKCRVYYPEMWIVSCFVSDMGLPPAKERK